MAVVMSMVPDRWKGARGPGRSPGDRGVFLVVLALVSALLVVSPSRQSEAVENGYPARSPAAQVRIFNRGVFTGGGTLVARDWAITVAHHFMEDFDNPDRYSLRFGTVDDQNDSNDDSRLRQIDRIVLAPRGDAVMVHFADPVPEGTWLPRLAAQAPGVFDWSRLYGWGSAGNGCSFDSADYATGTSLRMRLGPSSAPEAAGTRHVMVWCKTTTAFPDPDSPSQPVLRVSLTNADGIEVPVGMGWWDVTPDQVGTGSGQTLVDTDRLATC